MKTPLSLTRRAFSLVEVTLALGVAGFCLVAIFGLIPVALNSNRAAIDQTAATGILSSLGAELRATPPTNPPGGATTTDYRAIAVPANGQSGTTTLYLDGDRKVVNSATDARYRVTIDFKPVQTGSGSASATCARLDVSWPAVIDPATGTPAGSAEMFVALDRN